MFAPRFCSIRLATITTIVLVLVTSIPTWAAPSLSLAVKVTTEVSHPRTPVLIDIDFGAQIKDAGVSGVLDPNSIQVRRVSDNRLVPHSLSESFTWGDAGTVSWTTDKSTSQDFILHFNVTESRVPLQPQPSIPRIGTGDLLRYNASEPRPIVLAYFGGLYDLDGDGVRDLLGTWNYAYRAGAPWDGIIMYPGNGRADNFNFGELTHLRYVTKGNPDTFKTLNSTYMKAEFADFNGDGMVDFVYSPLRGDTLRFFLNTGRRNGGNLPIFEESITIARPKGVWMPCRAVDLDLDGALDLVLGKPDNAESSVWVRNINPKGWPFEAGEAKPISTPRGVCFFDVDEDGLLDAVGLRAMDDQMIPEYEIIWQRNLGETFPTFGEVRKLDSVSPYYPTSIAAVNNGPEKGLLVVHNVFQQVSFFPHASKAAPHFSSGKLAQSLSAVMSLSDQAWPNFCDWDSDGDLDILIGGGYGWPRIVINKGTTENPKYAEPQRILSEGKPIHLLRNKVLGKPHHSHNMGYSYPIFEDWDGDGLNDIIIPNETNRIFWYRNIGTKHKPVFGPQQLIAVDGYEETAETKKRSAARALKSTYPLEEEQPFYWRTGAAIFDWNNDGLMDLATHDGKERHLTLFTQYRDTEGRLRLKRDRKLLMDDERVIDDRIVKRSAHWTESFKPVDWNRDGLMDIMYSCSGTRAADGSIYLLLNVGSAEKAIFSAPRTMKSFGAPIKVTAHGPHPWVGDVDGDTFPDIVTCVEWSVYPFFSYAALEMDAPPAYTLGEITRAE